MEIDRATLMDRVAARSKTAPLMVQQRLSNHADIADLADQSLMAIRVITCKSDSDQKRHHRLRLYPGHHPA